MVLINVSRSAHSYYNQLEPDSTTAGSTCDTANKTKKHFLQLMNPGGTHKFKWLGLFEGLYYFFQQK